MFESWMLYTGVAYMIFLNKNQELDIPLHRIIKHL